MPDVPIFVKLIFAGTPDFAATALAALIAAGHDIIAVYTQPDRPAGRGQKLQASAVKALALTHGIPVYQPLHFKASTPEGLAAQLELAQLAPDLMVVAAYGLILPQAVLDIPTHGCLNIHASILPRWRGAAPIHRAILAGDTETGITIMQMNAGLDTGDILRIERCPILATDTSATLHDRLAILGGQAIVDTLQHLPTEQREAQPQQDSAAVYAAKLTKAEAQLDWNQSADLLDRHIRGLQPWPIAFTQLDEHTLRIWAAELIEPEDSPELTPELNAEPLPVPGTVVEANKTGIVVQCGHGQQLRLTQLQWPGAKVQDAAVSAQSQKIRVGMLFT